MRDHHRSMDDAQGRRAIHAARTVSASLAAASILVLVAAVVLTIAPVKGPPEGDTPGQRCIPVRVLASDNMWSELCATHVNGRLGESALAGCGAAVVGLLAFGIDREVTRNERQVHQGERLLPG